jgi:CO dehydrogenase maturation factor
MEAGVEHLGRGTAGAVDALIVVVEPGRRSLQTAQAIRSLAADLGIKRLYAVGNKVRTPSDEAFIAEQLAEFQVLAYLPADGQAIESDRQGVAVFEVAPVLVERARSIVDRLVPA